MSASPEQFKRWAAPEGPSPYLEVIAELLTIVAKSWIADGKSADEESQRVFAAIKRARALLVVGHTPNPRRDWLALLGDAP